MKRHKMPAGKATGCSKSRVEQYSQLPSAQLEQYPTAQSSWRSGVEPVPQDSRVVNKHQSPWNSCPVIGSTFQDTWIVLVYLPSSLCQSSCFNKEKLNHPSTMDLQKENQARSRMELRDVECVQSSPKLCLSPAAPFPGLCSVLEKRHAPGAGERMG